MRAGALLRRRDLPGLAAALICPLPAGKALAAERSGDAAASDMVLSERRQIFQGHGYQVWLPALRPGLPVPAFLERMRARFVRMSITAPVPNAAIRPGDSLEAMRLILRAAYEGRDRAGHARIRASPTPGPRERLLASMPLLARLGIETIAIVWDAPESLRADRVGKAGHARILPAEAVEDYARLITAQLLEIERISPDCLPAYVEAPNEPEGTWSTQIGAEAYAAFIRSLRAQMDAAGLQQIGLLGPGNGSLRAARDYVWMLRWLGAPAIDAIAGWSAHVWDNRIDDAPPVVHLGREWRDAIAAVPKSLFITEYNADGDRWNEPPFACGPRTTVQSRCNGLSADEDLRYGLNIAQQSLALIADGAAALVLWEAQDQQWGKRLGALDPAGRPKPAAKALATFMPFIPRDARVLVPRGGAPDGTTLCGFLGEDGRFVMAMAATGADPARRQQVRVDLAGRPGEIRWRSYPADAAAGMRAEQSPDGLQLSFQPQARDFVVSATMHMAEGGGR
jgi:hypothetical protein